MIYTNLKIYILLNYHGAQNITIRLLATARLNLCKECSYLMLTISRKNATIIELSFKLFNNGFFSVF